MKFERSQPESKKEKNASIERIENLEPVPLADRMAIILMMEKLKPASRIELHFEPNCDTYPKETFQRDVEELKSILTELGLPFELETENDESGGATTRFSIGRDMQALQHLQEAVSDASKSHERIGLALLTFA